MGRLVLLVAVFALCLVGCSEKPSGSVDAQTSARPIQPADLVYQGAFRLPDGPEEIGWGWSGQAMTYYPGGDPDGPNDGYLGSIFGVGHDWNQHVSEISIPKPIISPIKNLNELNTAKTLQKFHNIRGNLFGEMEQARAGLEYLPKQGSQTTDKLHLAWGQHFQETGDIALRPSHMWCELDLSNPKPAGTWWIGNQSLYSTNDYIFEIPQDWADDNTPNMRLATGRYRDGGWSGQGPCLFAFGPWNEGNPPLNNTHLSEIPLLLYSSSFDEDTTNYTINSPIMSIILMGLKTPLRTTRWTLPSFILSTD